MDRKIQSGDLKMSSKKILIVSGSFYPQVSPRSFRTTELAIELAKQGHTVKVYIPCEDYDYSKFEKEHDLVISDIGKLHFKDVEVKGGKIEQLARRVIKRSLKMLFEWPDIELAYKVMKVLKHENTFDLLISIAVPYPIHWGVALSIKRRKPLADCWVADCGDPYMGDRTDSFRKLFYFKFIEKWFSRKTNYITVPFEGAIDAYYPEFHDKIRIIPQGFNFEDLILNDFVKQKEYPVFAYAGGFIPGKRDPASFLSFLSKLDDNFRFVVFTSQVEMLANAKIYLKEKLEIRSLVPRKELLAELCQMDFLMNFDNNVSTQLPSKLIDYSITGRPVLNIRNDGDFDAFIEFLHGNYSKKMSLPPVENFDIKYIAKEFVALTEIG